MITHHMWIATWHASMYKAAPWLNILPLRTLFMFVVVPEQLWPLECKSGGAPCPVAWGSTCFLCWIDTAFFFFHQVKQSWFLVHSMKSGQEAESGALNTPAWADKPMHYFLLNSSSCKIFFLFLPFFFHLWHELHVCVLCILSASKKGCALCVIFVHLRKQSCHQAVMCIQHRFSFFLCRSKVAVYKGISCGQCYECIAFAFPFNCVDLAKLCHYW